jgi:adenylate cyclase
MPEGFCLSSAAYEQIKGDVDATFEDRGEQQLKNIARPVRHPSYRGRTTGSPSTSAGAPNPQHWRVSNYVHSYAIHQNNRSH